MIKVFFGQAMNENIYEQMMDERKKMIKALIRHAFNPNLQCTKSASEIYKLIREGWDKNFEVIGREDRTILARKYDKSHTNPLENLRTPGLIYLGEDIKLMSDADLVIFPTNWQQSNECVAMHDICRHYGIRHIILDKNYRIKR